MGISIRLVLVACVLVYCKPVFSANVPSSEVMVAARLKATELCGWSQASADAARRLLKEKEQPAAAVPELNTDQFYLKAGSPAADVVEQARRLCAEKELATAKQLEEVGERLEAELEQVKMAEQKQEGQRANAAIREDIREERTHHRQLAIVLALLAGTVAVGAWYAVKYASKEAGGGDPEQAAKENEDLKKRLNKLRAATAARA